MNTRIHTMLLLVALLLSSVIHAQTEVSYQRGSTQAEDILPPSPEAASAVKYAGVPFTHSLGTAEYEVPLYTLKGRQLEIPISLRYRSNGIKVDEIAGVAGLGWTLEAGGCVTRNVVYMPDEFNNWSFYTRPGGTLLTDLLNMTWSNQAQLFINRTFRNQHDTSADRYSYNVAGLSGTFVITPDREIIQLSGDGVTINAIQSQGYNGPITSFRITGPDGTIYVFNEQEVSTRQNQPVTNATPDTGQQVDWSATTAWYLTSIISADQRETANFNYTSGGTWDLDSQDYYQRFTNNYGDAGNHSSGDPTSSQNTNSRLQSSCETKILSSIVLRGITATFEYQTAGGVTKHKSFERPHLHNYPKRLSGLTVTSSMSGEIVDYEILTESEANDGRIILTGINEYHAETLTDRWAFNYKTLSHEIWRYSQDWYGYYNKENQDNATLYEPIGGLDVGHEGLEGVIGPGSYYGENGSQGGNNSDPDWNRPRHNLSPFAVEKVTGNYSIALKYGAPVPAEADYLSMTEANHDGAKTCFEYEGASLAGYVEGNYYIGLRVKQIVIKDNDVIRQTRHFTYENPICSGPFYPSGDYISLYISGSQSPITPSPSLSWHFTIHESSTSPGMGLSASNAVYGKVTELISQSPNDTIGVKNEYFYDVTPSRHGSYNISERFPSDVMDYYQNAVYGNGLLGGLSWLARSDYVMNDPTSSALLTLKKNYRLSDNGEVELYSSEEYEYSSPRDMMVLVGYQSTELMNDFDGSSGGISPQRQFHYPVYTRTLFGQSPVRVTKVGYHPSGNDTTTINYGYVSRATLDKPIRQSRVSIDGSDALRVVTYEYPDTTSLSGTWVNWLLSSHRLKEPIRQNYMRIDGLNATSTKTRQVQYAQFNGHLQPKLVQEFTDGVESWREEIFTRDNYGNVTSLKERGKPKVTVTWGYDGMYPTIVTNGEGSIAQSSTYSWIPGIGLASETTPQGITTSYEYDTAGRLARIKDTNGNTVEEYVYSLLGDQSGRKNIRKKTFLSTVSSQYRTDVTWYNSLGIKIQETAISANPNGQSLVSNFEGDYLLHEDVKSWLPFPIDALTGEYITNASTASTTYHQNGEAFHYKGYEESSRDKIASTSLPGYMAHKNTFSDNVRSGYPRYLWIDGVGVTLDGIYPSSEVLTEVSTDADGIVKTNITDRFGNVLGTEYGSGSERTTSSTRVYDNKGRLRAVIGGGIAITDSLNMWRYSYDALGRVSSKGIPGSIRELYAYDDEDRVISMTKGDEYTEYVYDALGRLTHRYLTVGNGTPELMEKHEFDTRSQDSNMLLTMVSQSLSSYVQNCGLTGMETLSKIAIIDENGAVDGYASTSFAYDKLGRPYRKVTKRTGSTSGYYSEEYRYDFRGNVTKSATKNGDNIGGWDILQTNNQYDSRDRITRAISSLTIGGTVAGRDTTVYTYDALGRLASTSSSCGGPAVNVVNSYTLQDFLYARNYTLDGNSTYSEVLYYDDVDPMVNVGIFEQSDPLHPAQGSYAGRITGKRESWVLSSGGIQINAPNQFEAYRYDSAGRLSWSGQKESLSIIDPNGLSSLDDVVISYDAAGNITQYTERSNEENTAQKQFTYSGHCLSSMISTTMMGAGGRVRPIYISHSFQHDNQGRMTYDGYDNVSIDYNHMGMPSKISKNGGVLAKYSYLADGTKNSAMTSAGTGYIYAGTFVYRRDSTGVLSFESAPISMGRMTASGAHYYMTDHLGSVKTIIRGSDGRYLEHSAYDAWGKRSNAPLPTLPATGESFRYHFSGKEDQSVDFSVPFTDFGARHYSPSLRRWLIPDPLSEKYYDVSPYAYCAGDPVNLVDEDGNVPHVVVGAAVGAVVGAVVNGGIALYEGKSGSEFWGAVAGGAVGGAIEGAVTAATGGVSLATRRGYIIAAEALGGLLSDAAQSVTDQAISSGSVDVKKVAIDSGVGFALGKAGDYINKNIRGFAQTTVNSIKTNSQSSATREFFTKEISKEYKEAGKPLGKAGRQEMKRAVSNRINTFVEVETTLVNMAQDAASTAVEATVTFGETEISEWLKNY